MDDMDIRNRIVNAVALAVVLPLMIVVYLMTRWAAGNLDSPEVIVFLTFLALVLIAGGLNILHTVDVELKRREVMEAGENSGETASVE